ncbi:MAG TPA: TetR/AcrR family transcriptional regulator, partial [Burkholderiaceae bacterium]|nr:TetR/AcrR family transcriptional regulator [Burkholderiaceae bacterium]
MRAQRKKKNIRPARARVRRGNQQDAEKLRGDLLDAAMQLFAVAGLEGVSMRAVAARCGVSAMTPYRYFGGKAELLRGLWQFVLRSLCDRMAEAIEAQSSGRGRVRSSLEAFLSYYEANPDHYRLLYMTEQTTQHQEKSGLTSAPVYAELLGLVRGVLEDFAGELGADTTHVKLAADMRVVMQIGYLHGTLVNVRYPWSDRSVLRAAYLEQTIAAVERCLLHGPPRIDAEHGRAPVGGISPLPLAGEGPGER